MRPTLLAISLMLSSCVFSSGSDPKGDPPDMMVEPDQAAADVAQSEDTNSPWDMALIRDTGESDAGALDVGGPDLAPDMQPPAKPFYFGYRESYAPLQAEENTCVHCDVGTGRVARHQFLEIEEVVLDTDSNGQFVEPLRLRSDWDARWLTLADQAQFEFDQGILTGVNLGADLIYNGLPLDELDKLADAVAERFPDIEIWVTYDGDVVARQQRADGSAITNFRFPAAVTLISVYSWHSAFWDGIEAGFVQETKSMYESYVFTRLGPGQRAILAPHAAARPNDSCNLACWDAGLALETREFGEWIHNESRLVGIAPWAWETFGAASNIGIVSLPATRQAYQELAASFSN